VIISAVYAVIAIALGVPKIADAKALVTMLRRRRSGGQNV
jgi:hypothetical protein